MPGLYGIVGNRNEDSFISMGNILNHYNYEKDSYTSEQLALGRLHLGTFFPSQQPVWDSSQRYGIMVDGYIIIDENMSDSQAEGHRTLKRLIDWYRAEGDGFLGHIKTGMFNLVIIDLENSKVKIINDRLGLLPLYYGFTADNSLCFAPEEKALIQTGIIDKQVDWVGLSELLYYYHLVGDRTFYQGVKMLEPAMILSYDLISRQSKLTSYFDYLYSERYDCNVNQWIDLLVSRIKESCQRLSLAENKYALMLSGGLDSRLILSAWNDTNNISGYTYGIDRCLDVKISQKVARKMGIGHFTFTYDANTFPDSYHEAMWTMEHLGHVNVTNFAKYIKNANNDIAMAGFLADVTLGGVHLSAFQGKPGVLNPFAFKLHPLPMSQSVLAKMIHRQNAKGMDSWLSIFLSKDVWQIVQEQKHAIYEDISAVTGKYISELDSIEKAYEKFQIFGRERRRFHLQQIRIRYQLEFIEPFCDYRFMDTIFSIPVELRAYRRLQFRIYQKRFPELVSIRRTGSYIPPAWPYYLQQLDQEIFTPLNSLKRRINLLIGSRLFHLDDTNDDYDRWFKNSENFNLLIRNILLSEPELVNITNITALLNKCENYKASIDPRVRALVSFVLWWQIYGGK